MILFTPIFKRIAKVIHTHPKKLFLFPWFGLLFWYAMLIALLAYWGGEGRPVWHWIYGWDITPQQYKKDYGDVGLVYISDIGATKMQGVFISLSCTQGIVYCLTVLVWYVVNYTKRSDYVEGKQALELESSSGSSSNENYNETKEVSANHFTKFTHHEKNLIIAALVLCCIGSLGILFCSIFDTRYFHHVHLSMVGIFLAGMAISVILTGTSFILTGKTQYKREYNVEDHSVGYKFWTVEYYQKMFANSWLISGVLKLVWVSIAILWAICFGAVSRNDVSAVFEWLLAFWYGLIFVVWSVDMYIHRDLSNKETV